jgi:hypothetical protein
VTEVPEQGKAGLGLAGAGLEQTPQELAAGGTQGSAVVAVGQAQALGQAGQVPVVGARLRRAAGVEFFISIARAWAAGSQPPLGMPASSVPHAEQNANVIDSSALRASAQMPARAKGEFHHAKTQRRQGGSRRLKAWMSHWREDKTR